MVGYHHTIIAPQHNIHYFNDITASLFSMAIPRKVLKDFFEQANEQLESLEIDGVLTPSMIRSLLLEKQLEVLHQIVMEHNARSSSTSTLEELDVQEALKTIPGTDKLLVELSKQLEETARFTYAKLTLYAACHRILDPTLRDQRKLQSSGSINRTDLMEFLAICRTGVKLSCVQKWLSTQTDTIFSDLPTPSSSSKSTTSPQERLKEVQALFLGELGYDADFVQAEIKRIFFSAGSSEFSDDQELSDTFTLTMTAMSEALRNATTQASVTQFSDIDKGGVTRVVGIDYLDDVDARSPQRQAIVEQDEEQQRQFLRMASQTASLQQEILQELMSLNEQERTARITEAKRVSEDILHRIMQEAPSQRIQILTSIDEPTKRLMAMHKLWESAAAAEIKERIISE
jgi:hypothetical protein